MKLGSVEESMADSGATKAGGVVRLPSLTSIQWLICGVAALGFAFDLYESLMTALIVAPVLTTLGRLKVGTSEFNLWVGLFFFLPALAGGIFGLFGGYLTDLLGRRRVLVWSILLYGFSACGASFSNSIRLLLLLRCTTWVGTCVEQVAAIAWLAELFPHPVRRARVLGYTQMAFGFGGLMVTGVYYLAVTYAEQLPAILGGHEAWRYTLLSGLIPAIPLMIVRPWLPDSPLWRDKKTKGVLKRPRLAELFQPALRKTTLVATLMMACSAALPFGALQHTPRIVPGLAQVRQLPPRQIQQTVSGVYMIQELGTLAGRLAFAMIVGYIVTQRRMLRVFVGPALAVFGWAFFFAATRNLGFLKIGVFCAHLLFNGLYSFWGNYVPRVFPTHLRGTGESFVINIGGRGIGILSAMIVTQLSNFMPGRGPAARLAHSAGTVAVFALVAILIASHWLREPESDQLPD